MKKLIIIAFTIFSNSLFSQVAIGKTSVDGDGLLDFENSTTKGLMLPIVTNVPSGANLVSGTMVMDYTTKKIMVYENNKWKDLSGNDGDVSSVIINPSTEVGNGVIIGNSTSSAEGILVLESNSKALILPKIFRPNLNVLSPYPGMICYDTYNRSIAIYNGTKWYYWR